MQKLSGASFKNIAIVLLIGIAVFSAYKYVITLKEKYTLMSELAEKKIEINVLEKEKQKLSVALEKEKSQNQKLAQEKVELQDNLKASRKRLSKLFSNFTQTDKAVDSLNTQVSLLKKENVALGEEKNKLTSDNEALKIKLNSIIELKKAISELKKQARRVGIVMIQQTQSEKTLEGNQGYLLKGGKSTISKKVKIEVTPALQNK
ncbi:MAG: hypothetical protein ABSE81_06790 [Candidatus Omnitrophota bacterium]|jgi:chromosome segregation ATPase